MALADPEDSWVAGLGRGGVRTVRRTEPDGGEGPPVKSVELEQPTVFIYDNLPGGVGFAEKLYALCDLLLEEARGLIRGCACQTGCPSCVGTIGEVEEGARSVAMDLADWLTGRIPVPRGPELMDEPPLGEPSPRPVIDVPPPPEPPDLPDDVWFGSRA